MLLCLLTTWVSENNYDTIITAEIEEGAGNGP